MTQIKTVCVDKVAYEAVLRNSVRVNDLEAENQQLKELLKEVRDAWVIYKPYDRNQLCERITNAIGEKK